MPRWVELPDNYHPFHVNVEHIIYAKLGDNFLQVELVTGKNYLFNSEEHKYSAFHHDNLTKIYESIHGKLGFSFVKFPDNVLANINHIAEVVHDMGGLSFTFSTGQKHYVSEDHKADDTSPFHHKNLGKLYDKITKQSA